MTEDTKAKIKRLVTAATNAAFSQGEKYSPEKFKAFRAANDELHAAIDSIDARGEAVATGPREAPTHDFILYDIGRMAKGAQSGRAVYGHFVPRGFICPQCHLTRVMSPKCPDCNYDADAHSARQDGGAPDNSKCKFASGGTDCVTWCGDQACLAKTWIDVPLPGRESTAQAGIAQSFGPVINPPTVLTTTAQAGAGEREDFEAWMVSEGYGEVPRICSSGSPCAGEYADQYWHRSWIAWQASRARAAAPNVLREALQAAVDAMREAAYDEEGYTLDPDLAEAHDNAKAALASPLPEPRAGEREGWKLVPIKPTEAMLEAMMDVKRRRMLDAVAAIKRGEDPDMIGHIEKSGTAEWRAALAASPIPTPEPQEGRDHAV